MPYIWNCFSEEFEFAGRKYSLKQKGNNGKCQCIRENVVSDSACEEDYVWNLIASACKCQKGCTNGKSLESFWWSSR